MNHPTASEALQLPFDASSGRIAVLMSEYPRYASRVKADGIMERGRLGPYDGGVFAVPVSRAEIAELLDALVMLPPGEAARCFNPGYTVEFLQDAQAARKVALSWECNAMQILAADGKLHNFNFDGRSESAARLLSRIRQFVEWGIDSEIAKQVRNRIIAGEMPSAILRELLNSGPGQTPSDVAHYLCEAFDDSIFHHQVWNWKKSKNSEIWDTQFNLWVIGELIERGINVPWSADYCKQEYARIRPLIAEEIAAEQEAAKQARRVENLLEKIKRTPGKPVCVQALWDGDSRGWFIELVVVMQQIDTHEEHQLATISLGGDIRLFNGQVPPWPEAVEATNTGNRLATELGIEFYFPSPDTPDDSFPRWIDQFPKPPEQVYSQKRRRWWQFW